MTAPPSIIPESLHGVIDSHATPPSGTLCPSCGCPVEAYDKYCPACGTPNQVAKSSVKSPAISELPVPQSSSHDTEIVAAEAVSRTPVNKHFRCETCGAEVLVDPQQRSYVCPFCDSNYVAEFTRVETGRQSPEFVIGFAITPEQAREKFRTWIRQNAWFNPSDLSIAAVADKQRGVYLPFWSFPMFAESEWSASIGEHWTRTETYTVYENGHHVTKTRTITETEWWPLQGMHHKFYAGYLVTGSKGLSQASALSIQPYNLPALKRYEPYFLAGWLCEEYSVDHDQALQLCQQHYYEEEKNNIRNFLPGDTSSQLLVETHFRHISSDLCLLPVYVLSYRYQNKLYRFLVNGQTGKHAGDKPISWTRVLIGVAIGVGLFILLLLLFMAVLGGR